MKSTSHYALAAAAGLFVGALAVTPAQAADLGGDCCADLEERVAELEATTVRKGNRVVSVQLYGQVNRALLIWDDGVDSDAYIVDSDLSSTRFGFRGSGTLTPGWTAGYRIEIQIEDSSSADVSQLDDEGRGDALAINLRRASWYVDSTQFGRVTVGQTSGASDDIGLIRLGGLGDDADNYWANNFFLRSDLPAGGGFPDLDAFAGVTWGDITGEIDPISRNDFIRYDSPSIYGFILSAAWGDDDIWDVGLRFRKEWNSIRVAAGVAYGEVQTFDRLFDDADGDIDGAVGNDLDFVHGSGGIQHIPSGVFLNFAGGVQNDNRPDVDFDVTTDTDTGFLTIGGAHLEEFSEEATFWWLQLGIQKNWFGYGATSLYVHYGNYQDFSSGNVFDLFDKDELTVGDSFVLTGSDVERWGAGFTQAFDSSALEIYGIFNWYDADLDTRDLDCGPGAPVTDCIVLPADDSEDLGFDSYYAVTLGGRIKF